jgi:hypothetical protein
VDEAFAVLDARRLANGLAMLLVLTFSLLAGSPAFAQTCLGGSSAACNAGGANEG